MIKVIISSVAEVDYTESLCWYAERSVEAASAFDKEFDRAIAQIASDPKRFPFCDERHQFFLMRRFPFRIIYRMIGEEVVVLAVAHASRSPDYWANR